MKMKDNLLLEFFSEEMPSHSQSYVRKELWPFCKQYLEQCGIDGFSCKGVFATPRRMVINILDLPEFLDASVSEKRGPRVGTPKEVVEKFAASVGLVPGDLKVVEGAKGIEYYLAEISIPQIPIDRIVSDLVRHIISNFPWKQSMKWGGKNLRWIRPLHSVLCLLHGSKAPRTIDISDLGFEPNCNWTLGHRNFGNEKLVVSDFDEYVVKLEKSGVVLDTDKRKQVIISSIEKIIEGKNLELVEDEELLEEVSGIVEWPVPILGSVGAEFRSLPPEVLKVSMRNHQKFFALKNRSSGLIENFIAVSNVSPVDGDNTIIKGYERVLRARLNDALFFFGKDIKVTLDDRRAMLSRMTFHNLLGSYDNKIHRFDMEFTCDLVAAVGADQKLFDRAAKICKTDLTTEMVKEFPELQGIIGSYYAEKMGENPKVAKAIREHYSPAGNSDIVPREPLSIALSIADKMDTLVGFWLAGKVPTGSKDPFALRRAALGIIRIILDNKLRLNLGELIHHVVLAYDLHARGELDYGGFNCDVVPQLEKFFIDRIKVFLKKDLGIRHDVIDAVICALELVSFDTFKGNHFERPIPVDLSDIVEKTAALNDFVGTNDGLQVVSAFNRAEGIVSLAKDPCVLDDILQMNRLRIDEMVNTGIIEIDFLINKIKEVSKDLDSDIMKKNARKAIECLGALVYPINELLDKVKLISLDGTRNDRGFAAVCAALNLSIKFALFSKVNS